MTYCLLDAQILRLWNELRQVYRLYRLRQAKLSAHIAAPCVCTDIWATLFTLRRDSSHVARRHLSLALGGECQAVVTATADVRHLLV